MKKIFLSIFVTSIAFNTKAQILIDTVSTGPTYANQVWYSLANDNQGSAAKNNWDLAFDVSGAGSTIHINSITGTTLWKYPKADTTGWNTLDTAGLSTWAKRWNSDTSWAMGVMGRYASATDPFNLDWGVYNSITHVVSGDSLYVIRLANGAYKKLQIRNLNGGIYNFRYADLNGTNNQNATVVKSGYVGQNFGYYSVQNNTALSREPASASWDLLFGQYTTFIPTPYTVTGILQNKGVKVAKAYPVDDKSTYLSYGAHSFKTAINTIGYDWKTFNGSSYSIKDSTVFFVQSKSGAIWKVIATGFGGSANGNFIFSKELLSGVGINELNGTISTFAVYPNPANGSDLNIALSLNEISATPVARIFDLSGKLVSEQTIDGAMSNELNLFHIDTQNISNGIYIVNVSVNGASANQKLIINK